MSHMATNWLADLTDLRSGEFQVLFRLCECHNPANGCFPSQEYLRTKCNMSNGSINNHLNSLEKKGHLRREKRLARSTFQQKTTRYFLSFEDGFQRKLTPNTGDGADSKKTAIPSPNLEQSRLQNMETKEVREPVKNDDDSAREEILIASGYNQSNLTATEGLVGGIEDMLEVKRWREELGLTQTEIIGVIKGVMKRAPINAPNSLKYFQSSMQEFAGRKAQPQLTAIKEGRSNGNRHQREEERLARIKLAARSSFV